MTGKEFYRDGTEKHPTGRPGLGPGAVKNLPPLDPDFLPILQFNRAFLATAKKPVDIAVERASGQMAVCHTFIHDTPEMAEADRYYLNVSPSTTAETFRSLPPASKPMRQPSICRPMALGSSFCSGTLSHSVDP